MYDDLKKAIVAHIRSIAVDYGYDTWSDFDGETTKEVAEAFNRLVPSPDRIDLEKTVHDAQEESD